MNRILCILVAFFFSSVLCGQEIIRLGKEDVLNAFKQYNPSALKKASLNTEYGELLNKLSLAYSVADTEENRLELIALVKNFDNSIFLQAVKMKYEKARTWQLMTGNDLKALDKSTYQNVLKLVKSIFANTIDVKKIQIDLYQQELKEIKKNKELSADQKKASTEQLENKIQTVKKEIKEFKTNKKQKIQDTARAYFSDIKSAYESQEAQMLQTKEPSVKSNPQKTAAQ